MKIVSHFGIHWTDEGVAFLEQGRAGTNAVGLRMKSPFQVQLPNKKRHCNHQFALNSPVPSDLHWDYLIQLTDDALVRAMLPIPKLDAGVYWLEESDGIEVAVTTLARMSSPIHPVVFPMWMTQAADNLISELHSTNVQPLVLTGIEPKHSSLIADLAKAATILPRRLILIGKPDVIVPQEAARIRTDVTDPDRINAQDFGTLPWEQLGATVVRKFMRRELNLQNNRNSNSNGTSKGSARVPTR